MGSLVSLLFIVDRVQSKSRSRRIERRNGEMADKWLKIEPVDMTNRGTAFGGCDGGEKEQVRKGEERTLAM